MSTKRKIRKPDQIEQAIIDCHKVCEALGVRLFTIGVGDKRTYQTFRRKETWKKFCQRTETP